MDITAIFPELHDHSAPTTRLHPRHGMPGVEDSSIGGPLLWPADEPWPHCDGPHNYFDRLLTPTTVHRRRAILGAAWRRKEAGESFDLTDEERAEMPDSSHSEPFELGRPPTAMIPVMQLFRRDVPGFIGPDDSDLMQVLWCPIDHDWLEYCPRLVIKWRHRSEVGEIIASPPEPTVVRDDYLPEPCVLHPEQVIEFDDDGLPEDLRERILAWERDTGENYFGDLSIAPGWKVGGFGRWNLTDPRPMVCVCGTDLSLLFRVDSTEWDGGSASWRPLEEMARQPDTASTPTKVVMGRGYSLWVYYCPRSPDHPHQTAMQ